MRGSAWAGPGLSLSTESASLEVAFTVAETVDPLFVQVRVTVRRHVPRSPADAVAPRAPVCNPQRV
jgi:hypothetical protein